MYQEHLVTPGLQAVVACTWEHSSDRAARSRVVPDACVDIIWDGSELRVAGPDTRPVEVEMQRGTQILGLRFVPGAASPLLGVPLSAVRDARVELRELWGDRASVLEQQLLAASDPRAALAIMEAAVRAGIGKCAPVDAVASAVANALAPRIVLPEQPDLGAPVPSVAQLSAALGVSERQLLRRCDAAFGYGPKLLARVLRFQAFVRALRTQSNLGLAELALSLGYADQAHLAHDTAELAGQTPSQLRTRWSEQPA